MTRVTKNTHDLLRFHPLHSAANEFSGAVEIQFVFDARLVRLNRLG